MGAITSQIEIPSGHRTKGSGYKTANNKTVNLKNTEHKTAKQQNSEITKEQKTKWQSLQKSEHYKKANLCEKLRIDHTEHRIRYRIWTIFF